MFLSQVSHLFNKCIGLCPYPYYKFSDKDITHIFTALLCYFFLLVSINTIAVRLPINSAINSTDIPIHNLVFPFSGAGSITVGVGVGSNVCCGVGVGVGVEVGIKVGVGSSVGVKVGVGIGVGVGVGGGVWEQVGSVS